MTVASIHQNSICCECGMVSENFLWHMHFFYFQFKTYLFIQNKIFKKLFALFLQVHETLHPSFPSLSSKRDHEEMEQGDDEVMEGTDKKIKTKKHKLKKYPHKPSTVAVRTHLSIYFFSNTLIPMDIQHSDIGCNKHQAIPAFQPVHLTQL